MKTIEEFASEYAAKWPKAKPRIESAVLAGANHIMSLPLSERLTAEERETIKAMYNTSKDIVSIENDSTLMYSMHTQIMCVLESIFGEKLFAEKGGSHD